MLKVLILKVLTLTSVFENDNIDYLNNQCYIIRIRQKKESMFIATLEVDIGFCRKKSMLTDTLTLVFIDN